MRTVRWALACALVVGSFTAVAVDPASAAPQTLSVGQLLAGLTTASEADPGTYDESLFPHWIDENDDGCDTRAEVLIAKGTGVQVGAECEVQAGTWLSPYDGLAWSDPSEVGIDVTVPLEEAWQSGASQWSTARRQAYANDLGFAGSLTPVSATLDLPKGSQSPDQWMPPDVSDTCTYITDWLAVKWRWDLSIDPAEDAFLAYEARGDQCGAQMVTVAKAAADEPQPDPMTITGGVLGSGGSLAAGWSLLSAGGAFRLVVQADGNLVIYDTAVGAPVWQTNTGGSGARLVMQADGNLVLYAGAHPVWFTNTFGNSGSSLVMQDDGNLVAYNGSRAVWASSFVAPPPPPPAIPGPSGDTLSAGARLASGASMSSSGGAYTLMMQADGNAVVSARGGRPVWTTGSAGNPGAYLAMQADGNAIKSSMNGSSCCSSMGST